MGKDIYLGVNIDHVATLRQARGTVYPRPVDAAVMVEHAGADSITVHLREDRRHIQDADLAEISEVMRTHMNLELAVTDEMIAIADNESDGEWDTALDPYETGEAPGDRHFKGANVVFCDGHARWYLQERLTERRIRMRQRWNNDFEAHVDAWGDGDPIE